MPSQVTVLAIDLVRDDGAAVYLNGVEVVRDNLAPGAAYNNYATGYGDDGTFHPFTIAPSVLVNGRNVLAAEVHQADAAGGNLSFDLQADRDGGFGAADSRSAGR